MMTAKAGTSAYQLILLGILLTVAAPAQTAAQTATTAIDPPPYNGARESIDGAHIPAIPGLAFSARVELETTKTLADGSSVTHHTYNIIGRDFRGRTHNEFRQWNGPAAGDQGKLTYAILYDPDTRTRTYLYPGSRLAREYVFGPAKPATPAIQPVATAPQNANAPTVIKEDLGTKFAENLQLTGIRETKTYPAGSLGNERPLAITSEYWYSPDLKINISVKRIDPRYGTQTVEVTELKREEPDAALFEIPADYKVVNETGATSQTVSAAGTDQGSGAASSLDRIRMGGNVQAAKLLEKVIPEYPLEARVAGISGTVRLHAVIAKDGTVQTLELVTGHPLLVKASLDAVRQWRYQPTLLNGNQVEVDTTIDVIYNLSTKTAPAPGL